MNLHIIKSKIILLFNKFTYFVLFISIVYCYIYINFNICNSKYSLESNDFSGIVKKIVNKENSVDIYLDDLLVKVYNELDACVAEIYPMSVEDCLRLEFKRSVVIMGNVSKDAEIHTDGSVFVLGSLEGTVYAGELGNTGAKVYANNMNPKCVCIADIPYKISKPEPEKKRFFGKKKEVSQANPAMLLSLVDNEIQFEIF